MEKEEERGEIFTERTRERGEIGDQWEKSFDNYIITVDIFFYHHIIL